MARPGMMLYFDILPALETLPKEAVGELMLAALHYAHDGTEPNFEDVALKFAWAFLRPAVDRDGATYDEKRLKGEWLTYCRKCKKDGAEPLDFEAWMERTDNGTLRIDNVPLETPSAPKPTTTTSSSSSSSTATSPSPSTTTTISPPKGGERARSAVAALAPPTLDEVTAYVRERGSKVDPQGFVDFYASKGWMVGKTPMKDWKAACRNAEKWERWDEPTKKQTKGQATGSGPGVDYQPTPERIQENANWLDEFLEGQGDKQPKAGRNMVR